MRPRKNFISNKSSRCSLTIRAHAEDRRGRPTAFAFLLYNKVIALEYTGSWQICYYAAIWIQIDMCAHLNVVVLVVFLSLLATFANFYLYWNAKHVLGPWLYNNWQQGKAYTPYQLIKMFDKKRMLDSLLRYCCIGFKKTTSLALTKKQTNKLPGPSSYDLKYSRFIIITILSFRKKVCNLSMLIQSSILLQTTDNLVECILTTYLSFSCVPSST